jgi:hypothetical protein
VPALDRARCLAEAADALDRAVRLLTELELGPGNRREAADLFVSIEAARLEVQSLRLSRAFNPNRAALAAPRSYEPWLEPSSISWNRLAEQTEPLEFRALIGET